MRILFIDNYDSFSYNLVHMIEEIIGQRPDVYRSGDISTALTQDYTHLVLSPGPGLPSESGRLVEVLEHCWNSHKILGVCLGLQAIAEVAGAQLKNLDRVYHGVQDKMHITESTSLYQGVDTLFDAGRYHSWVIKESTLPEQINITSRDGQGEIMSIEHRTLPIYGVQFHPESVMTPSGTIILKNFLAL